MCEKFIIHLHFKEVAILNVCEEFKSKDFELNFDFPISTAKIEVRNEKPLKFENGCKEIESCFILQSDDMIVNEDFMFACFGNGLEGKFELFFKIIFLKKIFPVNLSTDVIVNSKPSKKRKTESIQKEVITKGKINILKLFEQKERKSFVLMEIYNEMEIALSFELNLENSPNILSTLTFKIDKFLNCNKSQDASIEACIRFPYDENFRAAMMRKSKNPREFSSFHFLDDMLTSNNFEINSSLTSKMEFEYENYQTELGLKFLDQLIKNKQNLLIEFRIDEKMMMTFIDLDIFNYPGVHEMTFIVPLYEWNKSIIKELFQQEASLKDEKFFDKKGKKTSIKRKTVEINEPQSLIPITYEEKFSAISIKIKYPKPLINEETIEDFMIQLNNKFQFIDNENLIQKTLKLNDEHFKAIIEEIAEGFKKFLDENPEMSQDEIKKKMESIYNKNELKDAVKALIGNVYNVEQQTQSNHEFKLLMIKVFKILNRKMMKIIKLKWLNEEKQKEIIFEDNLRRHQIEEWIALKNKPRVVEILNNQLKNDEKDVKKLEELAFYEFKLENLKECQETVLKILKIDQYNVMALYFLAYLTYAQNDVDLTIIAMKCLLKLIPKNMEFLMILKELYEEIDYTAGIKYCTIYLRESEFHSLSFNESSMHLNINSNNQIIKILHQQLNFKFTKFLDITKEYLNDIENDIEVKIFRSIEALDECKFYDAVNILKSIEINDANEAIVRILKGNVYYSSHNQWRGVCEYEIAYNLCLKEGIKFPHIPALRCGLWYLDEMKNITKARQYLYFCCKNYSTFNSWNGFGILNCMEMSYKNAEKYLNCANQIHKDCGDNWIYLALVNCKIKRMDIALKCYLTAKNCGVKDNEIVYEVERELEI